MPRVRGVRRRSQTAKRSWAVAAIAVALVVGAGVVLVANSNGAAPNQSLQTSAWVRWASGYGRGGYVIKPASRQGGTTNGTAAQLSRQARQRLDRKSVV
jgi:hypothetical protein